MFGPLIADTSFWFLRRRGMAVAICASGNYVAGTIWPPIVQHFIETAGWRATHIGIGIACLVGMLPLALVLRRRAPRLDRDVPSDPQLAAHGTDGRRSMAPCCADLSRRDAPLLRQRRTDVEQLGRAIRHRQRRSRLRGPTGKREPCAFALETVSTRFSALQRQLGTVHRR